MRKRTRELRDSILEDYKAEGGVPVEGVHISKRPYAEQRKFAEQFRRDALMFYSSNAVKNILGEIAKEYVKAYQIMKPKQIIDSYLRETELQQQETSEYLRDLNEAERRDSQSQLIIKSAALFSLSPPNLP
jgi:uroporphyrinogen-III synthase